MLLQDVKRGVDGAGDADGEVSLSGVSKDRMVSVHDPDMRHGHKSKQRRFDGHKAAIVVDTDTQPSILRWSTRLRPFGLSGSIRKITGSIRSHRSSGTSHIVGRVSLFPIIHHHTTFPNLDQTPGLFSLSHQSYFEIVTNTTAADSWRGVVCNGSGVLVIGGAVSATTSTG